MTEARGELEIYVMPEGTKRTIMEVGSWNSGRLGSCSALGRLVGILPFCFYESSEWRRISERQRTTMEMRAV